MKPGIYDLLVTDDVRRALDALSDEKIRSGLTELEEHQLPDYLARHLMRQIRIAMNSLPVKERIGQQVALANRLIGLLGEGCADEAVTGEPKVLTALYSTPEPPPRPTTPLSSSDLLMNAVGQTRLGFELEREMKTADSVLMLVSFIQWRGWQRLRAAFEELAAAANLSPRQFSRVFTAETGLSPAKAVERLRVEAARAALEQEAGATRATLQKQADALADEIIRTVLKTRPSAAAGGR